MAITTKEEVKSYLGITVSSNDDKIEKLIPLYEELYLKIRNAPFELDTDDTTIYPIGSDITIAEMIGYKLSQGDNYNTIVSEQVGNYRWSADTKNYKYGFPASIINQIKVYTRGV